MYFSTSIHVVLLYAVNYILFVPCSLQLIILTFLLYFIFLNIFLLTSERKGEGESDRNINDERESLIGCLPHTPEWGPSLQCWAMCPDRELNPDLLVQRSALNHGAMPAWPCCILNMPSSFLSQCLYTVFHSSRYTLSPR
uniref:Uncharacterized protein n=1 Tax=Myotis myotis TaxID=51298 RepID=A0A7J7SR28_MYOMY|nr:hypothetical protein mMyoMyo1_009303 [Myotis myotis]